MSWEEHLCKRVIDLERKLWDLQDRLVEKDKIITNLYMQLAEKQNELEHSRSSGDIK